MLPRSATAPIAMGISDLIGGIPSLTAIITIITGIMGASFGTFALDF
jgi:putative effector of murein hydrolase